MKKNDLKEIFLTRANLYKLGLMIFGLTLFPTFVHLFRSIFIDSTDATIGFYGGFYSSLLDMGKDGLIAWSIACALYIAYEIYLFINSALNKSLKSLPRLS